MRSGGFGLGKKQVRNNEPKRTPPTSADLSQLLWAARTTPDRPFSVGWVGRDGNLYTLTLINSNTQRDRRNWSSGGIDNPNVGEVDWKLSNDSLGNIVFSMRTSDAYLIHTLIEEASVPGTPSPVTAMPAEVAATYAAADERGAAQPENTTRKQPGSGLQEGSLRRTSVRQLLETYNAEKITGRLICDIGTVQSEVFLTDGEPVHAKSCHSISQGRDTSGDVALIDLLTWKDGTYKFQEGWPAASKTITSPLHMFLSGSVVPQAVATAAASVSNSPTSGFSQDSSSAQVDSLKNSNAHLAHSASPAPTSQSQAAPPAPSAAPAFSAADQDDFARIDDLIGATYMSLVESSGLLKYGMFLMLVRSEFLRLERSKSPFCFACISMALPNGVQLSDAALGKIGERFEKVCQPLDLLSYAGEARFYALFPQTQTEAAALSIKQFMNNVTAIPLDTNLHGSAVKFSAGLSEVPRDGAEFQQVFRHAGGLRGQATAEKKIVTSSF